MGSPIAKVLVVDDDASVRRFLAEALRRSGYAVDSCPNGAAALDHLRRTGEPIDLLISDAVMPRLGGRELLWRVKEMLPGVPVILMSGYLTEDTIYSDIDIRADIFLQKPFGAAEVLSAVRKILAFGPTPSTDFAT